MTRAQTKDVIWHSGKTLLCAIQFWILFLLTFADFQVVSGTILYPAILIGFFVVLWRYYDTIDDRSFNKVCKAETPPKFLEDPAYLAGISQTKKGALSGKALTDEATLEALERDIGETLSRIGRDMLAGRAPRTPSADACRYCCIKDSCPEALREQEH